MAKYLIDYECSLYFTEYIEANSREEACRIADDLFGSCVEYNDRMIEGFTRFPISLENAEVADVLEVENDQEVTLTAEEIKHYLKED